ncbi:hypothetical protein D4764_14G0002020 [Takifugu flavidus]|uniref:Uncharacterized protein n=1 Tax=Takifugu flavidus TaxID=433684 RepID=A0A5C6P5Z2_9TELE|nr:hypothetical protein D4764_14G0002020 [Takifugu flavidus]
MRWCSPGLPPTRRGPLAQGRVVSAGGRRRSDPPLTDGGHFRRRRSLQADNTTQRKPWQGLKTPYRTVLSASVKLSFPFRGSSLCQAHRGGHHPNIRHHPNAAGRGRRVSARDKQGTFGTAGATGRSSECFPVLHADPVWVHLDLRRRKKMVERKLLGGSQKRSGIKASWKSPACFLLLQTGVSTPTLRNTGFCSSFFSSDYLNQNSSVRVHSEAERPRESPKPKIVKPQKSGFGDEDENPPPLADGSSVLKSNGRLKRDRRMDEDRAESTVPSWVSLKSDRSKDK